MSTQLESQKAQFTQTLDNSTPSLSYLQKLAIFLTILIFSLFFSSLYTWYGPGTYCQSRWYGVEMPCLARDESPFSYR